jgi:hypothetical protein
VFVLPLLYLWAFCFIYVFPLCSFFFFYMSTQVGIRTSDLRFMRCGLQPIELSLGDFFVFS